MNILLSAQQMAAAVFVAVASLHFLIWNMRRSERGHLFFALTAFFAAANAMAEAWMYQATSVAQMTPAVRWYVAASGGWLISLAWFVYYSGISSSVRRWFPAALSTLFSVCLIANFLMPSTFLYSELTGIREGTLPWGGSFHLADGVDNPWRFAADLGIVALLFWTVSVFVRLGRIGQTRRAWLVGSSLTLFLLFSSIHAALVDTQIIDTPYLSSYGFLAVMLVMSLDLAGEVIRASVLSERVTANERRWSSMLKGVQLYVVAVGRKGLIDYVNPHFEKNVGYSSNEIIGKSITVLLPENQQAEGGKFLNIDLIDGETPTSEMVVQTKHGDLRDVVWSNVVLRDASGEYIGAIGIGADVTDQRSAELDRDQAMSDLKRALDEVKSLKLRLEAEVDYLQDEIKLTQVVAGIIGQSDAIKYVLHKIEKVAHLDTTVLIEGETGVGKELVARAIHNQGNRKDRPLVKVNCAALPPNLIESELFGHVKGAFTGAETERKGRFELADGGTLFLDEVGELPLEAQSKLLRVLQEGEFERLGGSETIQADVRIIAATNRELREEIARDRFREDLYYRMSVYPITVPPLRQRADDLPLLVSAFVERFGRAQGKQVDVIPNNVMQQFLAYNWPGNVRELQNVIERCVIVSTGEKLKLAEPLATPETIGPIELSREGYLGKLEDVESEYICRVLVMTSWRVEGDGGAADLLGLNPSTLRSRMRKLGIHRSQSLTTQPDGIANIPR